MIKKPLAAFGYVCVLRESKAGSIINNAIINGSNYFYTKGRVRIKILDTDNLLEDRIPGILYSEITVPGTALPHYQTVVEMVEDTQWLCIPSSINKEMPKIESLFIKNKVVKKLYKNENILLVRGSIIIDDKLITGPSQIRIRLKDVDAIAQEDCYCLYFR